MAAAGLRTASASTKFRYRIESILEREGLAELIDTVIGAEDVKVHKPDPACLIAALRGLDVAADEALYVGDSVVDAEAAQRATIDFVAVLTGTTQASDFGAFSSLAVLDDLTALPEWVT